MRVPEFRAYDKDKKIMIHDFDQSIAKHYDMKWGDSIHLKVYTIGLAYGTLSEWTGMYDKEDTKVFEGDVITSNDDRDYTVEFRSGCILAIRNLTSLWTHLIEMDDYQVTGNIYE